MGLDDDELPRRRRIKSDFGMLGRVYSVSVDSVNEYGYTVCAKIDRHVYCGAMFNPGRLLNDELPFMQQTKPLLGDKISLGT